MSKYNLLKMLQCIMIKTIFIALSFTSPAYKVSETLFKVYVGKFQKQSFRNFVFETFQVYVEKLFSKLERVQEPKQAH